jgi:hypothetical protein
LEEMCKPNIMFLISSIENVTKIVMNYVKNYVKQCTNHVIEDKKNYISFFRIGLSYEVVETQ